MKMQLLPLFILLLVSFQGTARAIVGGRDVPTQDPLARRVLHIKNTFAIFDPEARVTRTSVSHCTASAISPRVVLTAAHCALADRSATANYVQADGTEISIPVVQASVPPDFSDTNDGADIALMLLESDLPSDFEILSLPEKNADLKLTQITAAGFGKNDGHIFSGRGWGQLRSTELSVFFYLPTEKLFSVSQTDGHGGCDGDSGGPAIIEQNRKNFVIGVFEKTVALPSTDPDRDTCSYYGFYVNVQTHVDWILETLKIMTSASK